MVPFTAPQLNLDAFNCPLCGAYTDQHWSALSYVMHNRQYGLQNWRVAICRRCREYSVWYEETMIFPDYSGIPAPNADLEDHIKADYLEAASIVNKSPRGAAALLRLCVQSLCRQLGESGKNINSDIRSLVAKGLPVQIQHALDIVRIIGNESVHPGVLDMRDDRDTAIELFNLINIIAETRISQPKHLEEFYNSLPEAKRDEIDRQDGRTA